jgi:hypothetical protein
MSEENRALALRAAEIVNQRNPALIEELYPPDFVWHGPDRDIRSYELAEQSASMFLAAFPDAHITVERRGTWSRERSPAGPQGKGRCSKSGCPSTSKPTTTSP